MTLEDICSEVRNFIANPEVNAFETTARAAFAFQYECNPSYRSFCKARGQSPDSVKGWREIPAVVSTAFKDLELSVLPPDQRTTVFHSSGTTGQRPSRHFHSPETLRVYEDSLLRWFRPHVCPGGGKVNFLVLAPRVGEAPRSSLVHMFETVSKNFGLETFYTANSTPDSGWLLDFERIQQAHQFLLNDSVPVVICATAFSFVHWCDELERHRTSLEFPPGSTVFETGGYKGRSRAVPKSELHQAIQERLSIPESQIVSEYGMSELSSQAYDRTAGQSGERVFHFPPWARASVISPETGEDVADGETGLLRIFDLANVGSVCAIQTEDLAVRHGAGFTLQGRAAEAEARGCSLLQVNA